jgi:exosortase/archaeosortase family protein
MFKDLSIVKKVKSFVVENKQMILFVVRVAIIYIAWKIISWFLGEEKTPIDDRVWPWLSTGWETFNDWVRIFILNATKLYFDLTGYSTHIINHRLIVDGLSYVGVGNYCLAIQLWVFFVALICSYPGKWIKKLWFSALGVFLINIINILRIIVIVYAAHYYPDKIQFNHDYIFNVVVYIFTFFMWIWWVKKINTSPEK